MAIFYENVGQNLNKWTPKPPKIIEAKKINEEEAELLEKA